MCITYTRLNQFEQALAYCKEALGIAKDTGDRQRAANNLNNIGSIYSKMNEPRKALRYYRRSLNIKEKFADRAGEARALNNIGETYWRMRKLDAAEKYLEQSLQMKAAIGDLARQSATYQNLALLHSRRGNYPEAKSSYMEVLILNSRTGRPELTWRAFDGLSYVYASLSMPELAILYGKQAIETIQKTRAHMAGLEKTLRLSYLADKERVYRHVADLLIRQGLLPEAQQAKRSEGTKDPGTCASPDWA